MWLSWQIKWKVKESIWVKNVKGKYRGGLFDAKINSRAHT
jgi:hypothetical protein